ncbi:SDR family oxidoreductase [Saccharopolyspora shandongensis]|uniref:SDR family NAD(P)-dependent oxidoreductase n=1 Tax=Saccharopolyspora shandongensis TaxID=418495 RepID=UPI0034013F82
MKGFITGGSRGIGLAVAEAVADRCTDLTISGRNETRLLDAKAAIERTATGCTVHVLATDQADLPSFRAALADWIGTHGDGGLDFAVLNAGTYTEGDLAEIDVEDFLRDLDVNLNSNLVAIQTLLPALRSGARKRVIITGSTAAYGPYPLVPSYGVAKGGLRALAANLRVELAPDRIGVSFVSPGGTMTDMREGEGIPLGRLRASRGRADRRSPHGRRHR